MFQIYTTRFFQQFLTDIVLKGTNRKLPDDLIKEILDLVLRKKEDISDTRGMNLFLLSDIHPSAELRCILLELVFRESERLERNSKHFRIHIRTIVNDILFLNEYLL